MSMSANASAGKPALLVVGAGFSGTLTAVHLARLARSAARDVRIVLCEQGTSVGRGRAYATSSPLHLLNVPAGRMSAFSGEPAHFLDHARERDPAAAPGDFLPRALYGGYVQEILDREARAAEGRIEVTLDEVVDLDPLDRGLRATFASGAARDARAVVLATGHPLPPPPLALTTAVTGSGRYREDPWDHGAVEQLSDDAELLLIGGGLTAIDVIVEARRLGFRGTIRVVSRRGLLPAVHQPPPADLSAPSLVFRDRRVRAMLRTVRLAIRDATWRVVIDSLRPVTQDLWRSLPIQEKRRFLRHVRAYWDVHRHRVAPAMFTRLEEELARGTVVRHAARIVGMEAEPDGLGVAIRPRGGSETRRFHVQRVINCTGPNTGIEMCGSRLTKALLAKGVCRADAVGIGLACDPHGAVLDSSGIVSDRLYAVGPLRKGELGESTAVPELREQAERVARRVLENART